jgi:hypothetical protein
LGELVEGAIQAQKHMTVLFGAFAILAIALATVRLYRVVSSSLLYAPKRLFLLLVVFFVLIFFVFVIQVVIFVRLFIIFIVLVVRIVNLALLENVVVVFIGARDETGGIERILEWAQHRRLVPLCEVQSRYSSSAR